MTDYSDVLKNVSLPMQTIKDALKNIRNSCPYPEGESRKAAFMTLEVVEFTILFYAALDQGNEDELRKLIGMSFKTPEVVN